MTRRRVHLAGNRGSSSATQEPKNSEGNDAFSCMKITSEHVDEIISFIKTAQGFSMTGVALCDGEAFVDGSGTAWNFAERVPRAYKPNIVHEGNTILAYKIEEDTQQKVTFNIGDLILGRNAYSLKGAIREISEYSQSNSAQQAGGVPIKAVEVQYDKLITVRTSRENRPKAIYIPFFSSCEKN